MRKALFALLLLFSARPLLAQTAPEGIWQGYDGEWRHVSSQLLALAEAGGEGDAVAVKAGEEHCQFPARVETGLEKATPSASRGGLRRCA